MGKSLLELLADKATIPPQPGNAVPLTNATRNTIIPNSIGEVVKKLVGEQGLQREEANLVQVKNFVKNIPKIYGTDSVRILTQSDPHKKKVAIKKVAGAIGGVLGPIGKAVSKFAADFNPKFPDDFLEGSEEEKNLSFYRYKDLYASNYANGKYYNGGIKNSKTGLGKFLQANKTPGQLKDAAIGTAKSLAVGLAVAGIGALIGKIGKNKKKKGNTNPAKKETPPVPFFPSTFVMNSNPNDNETIAYNQEQQLRDSSWPTKIGKEGTIINIRTAGNLKGTASKINRKDELASLTTLYSKHYDTNLEVNKDTDTFMLYGDMGYYSPLMWKGTTKDPYARIGTYSKDVLRIFDINKPSEWTRYPTIKDFENAEPEWDNLIPNDKTGLLKFGTQNVSSLDMGGQINKVSAGLDNWISYWTAGNTIDYSTYWIKPVRWNSMDKPYSKQVDASGHNTILDQDYYFASSSFQSQNNAIGRKGINPYIELKKDILKNNNTNDRLKFKIGDVILLATLNGLTDNTTPSWTDVKSVGSGFKFYLYDSWEREINFKFRMYAESEAELQQIYDKAELIKEYTLPKAAGNLGVFGKLIKLNIGDLINEEYGFLTQANLSIVDESPWEVTDGLQKPFVYDMDITYKVVANKTKYTHYTTNKINTKAFEIKTKAQQISNVNIPAQLITDIVIGPPPQINSPYIPIEDLPPIDPMDMKDGISSPIGNPLLNSNTA